MFLPFHTDEVISDGDYQLLEVVNAGSHCAVQLSGAGAVVKHCGQSDITSWREQEAPGLFTEGLIKRLWPPRAAKKKENFILKIFPEILGYGP